MLNQRKSSLNGNHYLSEYTYSNHFPACNFRWMHGSLFYLIYVTNKDVSVIKIFSFLNNDNDLAKTGFYNVLVNKFNFYIHTIFHVCYSMLPYVSKYIHVQF